MVFQSYGLYPNMNVYENIRFPLKVRGVDPATHDEKVRRASAMVELDDFLHRKPAELSGGQRQSVAIARAVHFNAKILIMDEPTAALGPAETAEVRHLITQLKAEGIGIFLISHDIHDVFDLADRISVMLQGKLVGTVNKADVTKDEVLAMIIMGKHPGEVTQDDVKELHDGA